MAGCLRQCLWHFMAHSAATNCRKVKRIYCHKLCRSKKATKRKPTRSNWHKTMRIKNTKQQHKQNGDDADKKAQLLQLSQWLFVWLQKWYGNTVVVIAVAVPVIVVVAVAVVAIRGLVVVSLIQSACLSQTSHSLSVLWLWHNRAYAQYATAHDTTWPSTNNTASCQDNADPASERERRKKVEK